MAGMRCRPAHPSLKPQVSNTPQPSSSLLHPQNLNTKPLDHTDHTSRDRATCQELRLRSVLSGFTGLNKALRGGGLHLLLHAGFWVCLADERGCCGASVLSLWCIMGSGVHHSQKLPRIMTRISPGAFWKETPSGDAPLDSRPKRSERLRLWKDG